jgi:hypothetical protein
MTPFRCPIGDQARTRGEQLLQLATILVEQLTDRRLGVPGLDRLEGG